MYLGPYARQGDQSLGGLLVGDLPQRSQPLCSTLRLLEQGSHRAGDELGPAQQMSPRIRAGRRGVTSVPTNARLMI